MGSLAEKSKVSPQGKNGGVQVRAEDGKDDNGVVVEEESLHFTMLESPYNKSNKNNNSNSNNMKSDGGLDASDRSNIRRQSRSFDHSQSERSTSKGNKRISSSMSNDLDTSVNHIFANRENCAIKWQRARCVIGALEVHSEPFLRFRDDLIPHTLKGQDTAFQEALQAWEDLKLRNDFIKACEKLPTDMCCCGFLNDGDATKRRFVKLLNEGWVKQVNKKLLKRGVKVDVFLWHWQNASGKSETNIILIRFFETSTSRFRRASKDGSLDLELLDLEDLASEGDSPEVTAPERAEIMR